MTSLSLEWEIELIFLCPDIFFFFFHSQTLSLREQLSRRRSGLEEPGKDGDGQVKGGIPSFSLLFIDPHPCDLHSVL